VGDFLDVACKIVNVNKDDCLRVDASLNRPIDVNHLIGDFSKAKEQLGWSPKVTFKSLVSEMVLVALVKEKKLT
jgi:GDPmannose 4,6-dehydratase